MSVDTCRSARESGKIGKPIQTENDSEYIPGTPITRIENAPARRQAPLTETNKSKPKSRKLEWKIEWDSVACHRHARFQLMKGRGVSETNVPGCDAALSEFVSGRRRSGGYRGWRRRHWRMLTRRVPRESVHAGVGERASAGEVLREVKGGWGRRLRWGR
ncbi:hypothetical protein B0H11DRAFT_1914782 [Mycena galericulata]|nr:hypothetical protein B0H11DRAFT_1914782 [Mycena galericulata]